MLVSEGLRQYVEPGCVQRELSEGQQRCGLRLLLLYTHTHPFNGPFSETTQVSRYQKGKTNLDFTEARDSGWQWHQLGHMQVCISLQTDNHASTPPLSFLQAGCPSCRPTNSVKALKAKATVTVAACCCCLDAGVGGSAPVRGAGLCTTGAV